MNGSHEVWLRFSLQRDTSDGRGSIKSLHRHVSYGVYIAAIFLLVDRPEKEVHWHCSGRQRQAESDIPAAWPCWHTVFPQAMSLYQVIEPSATGTTICPASRVCEMSLCLLAPGYTNTFAYLEMCCV